MGTLDECEYDDKEAGADLEKVASNTSQGSTEQGAEIKTFKRSGYVRVLPAQVVASVYEST